MFTMNIGLLAPVGASVVTQSFADLIHWTDAATNTIPDLADLEAVFPLDPASAPALFHLRVEQRESFQRP